MESKRLEQELIILTNETVTEVMKCNTIQANKLHNMFKLSVISNIVMFIITISVLLL